MLDWILYFGLAGVIGFCITVERLIGSLKNIFERQTEIIQEMNNSIEKVLSAEGYQREILTEQRMLLERISSGINILQQRHYEPQHFKYFIVSSSHLDDLQAKVKSFLDQHWMIIGGVNYDATNKLYLQSVCQGDYRKTQELIDQLKSRQKT